MRQKENFSVTKATDYLAFESENILSYIYYGPGLIGNPKISKLINLWVDHFSITGIGTELAYTALNLEDDLENLWCCLNDCFKKIKGSIVIDEKFKPEGTDIKIEICYDGNSNDPKDVNFVMKKDTKSSPTILECKDEDKFQELLLMISQCFSFGITNGNKVKCTFINEVIKELSKNVSTFDSIRRELEKTGEYHELVKVGDTQIFSSFKLFLFNHSRHILLYAKMLSDLDDDLIN